jgi:hypothetical protein
MLASENIEKVKASFYGWEYCVEKGLSPTITYEDIELLSNVFIELEDQKRKIERLENRIEPNYELEVIE